MGNLLRRHYEHRSVPLRRLRYEPFALVRAVSQAYGEESLQTVMIMAALSCLVGNWDDWIRWRGAVIWYVVFTEDSARVWN